MKKIFFPILFAAISLGSYTATAQNDKIKDNKNEEIIIRKNGSKDVKVTVEMKGDDVLINGKPISEFKDDDVAITKLKKIMRGGDNMFMAPNGENMEGFFNENDGEGKTETRTFLGVTTDKTDNGVKIIDVAKASAAEKAGLKEGDVITKIESKKINDPENLMDVVRSFKPKDEVKIYYERNGKSSDTKATLGEKKESMRRSFSFKDNDMSGNILKHFNFETPNVPGSPRHPFFNFGPDANRKLGLRIEDAENNAGVKITNVEPGSVAENAGLKKDDIIIEVNGKKVENVGEVRDEVLQIEESNYTLKAKRNGSDMNFEIKIPKKANSADL